MRPQETSVPFYRTIFSAPRPGVKDPRQAARRVKASSDPRLAVAQCHCHASTTTLPQRAGGRGSPSGILPAAPAPTAPPDTGRLLPSVRSPTSLFRKANTLCTLASDPARRNPR